MDTTPASLLEQIRRPGEQAAWERFVRLYYPLIYGWARRSGVPADQAEDLVQEVLIVLIRKMPEFEYDRTRSFRGWLRTVTHNAWRNRRRVRVDPVGEGLADLADSDAPPGMAFEAAEYRRHLALRALRLMQADFQETTWRACWASVVEDRPPADVAAELGITVNAVYIARSRVLRRLHRELDGLLD